MARDLTNIRFTRVALVDKGANFDEKTGDGAHIMLWKRDVKKDGPDLNQVHVDSIGCLCENCKKKKLELKEKRMKLGDLFKVFTKAAAEPDAEKRTAELSRIQKALDTPGSPEHEAAEGAAMGTLNALHPDHVAAMKAHHEQLGQAIADYGAGPHPAGHPVHAMKALYDQIGKAMSACAPQQGDMTKMDDATIEKRVKEATTDLEKRLTASETLLKSERNQRRESEMTVILKSFKATPFNVDEKDEKNDIKKFVKMQESDPEGYDRMMVLFKAADAQLAQSALFKNVGAGGSGRGAGSAEAQLIAKAEAIISKGEKGMTKEQAFEQASLENPTLVAQYRREQQ